MMKRFFASLLALALLICPIGQPIRADGLSASITPQSGGGIRAGFDAGISSSGSGQWTPAKLGSAVSAWWKADTGVYKDAGITPAANGDTVQQWNDQSANGCNFIQATAGARPTFQTAGYNGAKSVTYVAANSTRMATNVNCVGIGAGNNTSWFAVGRENAATSNFARIVTYVASAGGTDFGTANSLLALAGVKNNSNLEAFQNGTEVILSGISTNNDYRYGNIYDGTKFNGYINGVAQSTANVSWSIGSPGTIMVGADLTVTTGAIQPSAVFWDGPLSEIVVVNRVLTAGEITLLEDYLRTRWNAAVPRAPPSSILVVDTDNAVDVGDVGAIQAAIALAKNGETNLGLVLANSRNDLSAECARVILAANGLGSTPIGAYQGALSTISVTSPYTSQVVARFGNPSNTRSTYADGVTQSRTVLAAAANNSVIWASVGFGPNLAGLLASAADGISPLTGSQLFAAKVSRLVVMGGDYPSSASGEFNFSGDPADFNAIFANKPVSVPTYLVGVTFPNNIIGGPAQNGGALVSPSYYAYTLAGDNQGGGFFTRPLWDVFAVTFAVRGDADGNLLVLGQKGTNSVNATTALNTWTPGSDTGPDSFLFARASAAAIQTAMDALVAPIR